MMHTRSALALAVLVGMAGCTDLKEYPVTGVTAGYSETPAGAAAAALGTYAGLRGIYGGEAETRLFMVGTDSWEKGDQLDANGAATTTTIRRSFRRRSAAACRTCGRLLFVDQHREYRYRRDRGVEGSIGSDEEHSAR
jgi:hypothetical protein